MIYLDGSSFFFDIEGCFSKLCESARQNSADIIFEETEKKLKTNFAFFFGTKPEYVRMAKDYKIFLSSITLKSHIAVIPECDISINHFIEAFDDATVIQSPKTSDMKIRAIEENNDAQIVLLTNPCCPSGLELTPDEIKKFALSTEKIIVVDESHMVGEENSTIKLVSELDNLVVLKKMRFGGEILFAVGKNLPNFSSQVDSESLAVTNIIFEHDSALKTALRKLTDSRDSLYIRIKKLAIKYSSVERLFRTRSDSVFFKVKDAEGKALLLFEQGIKVLCTDGGLCIFAGDKEENEAVLSALEKIL